MDLEKFVAVSGMSGLFKLVANRNNGLILEDLNNGKRKFVPSRGNQFTPLASIGIFTNDGETAELKAVFKSMADKQEAVPLIDPGSPAEELHRYFLEILPEYDRDKVHTGDIKKVIRWFSFLQERDLLNEPAEAGSEEEE
ncbi:MAG: DUF5606 domain-containing protein [Haliscomenobacter sp.]|nr:DUF5606 domain-containing protein [Haliscomenobacter sp.]MBK8655275.1 DUF5606 domain-containing protein [Haliscomenobacter sp.]MBP9075695.1 DUF5606 domain-containing protein [Haliscomenobacter sp.]MBP9873308.1 DUF5606 domain-containing protein [Haliscomenobacter sp.]